MDHILNELSLAGQFQSVDDFVREGALPLADVLADIAKFGGTLLYKKSDFYYYFDFFLVIYVYLLYTMYVLGRDNYVLVCR